MTNKQPEADAKLAPLKKSEGTTDSEKYLARLCERSFLSLWSYPNVFRNQGGAEGKELCDVLIVFDQHIIIFSDKSCNFPDTGNLYVDWARWFRRAIQKSADQILGAERWIKEHPDRIFLDRACTQKFPLPFPAANDLKIHRIVVALNAGERCKAFFENSGTGSLTINSDVEGVDHSKHPFTIGRINPSRGYIQVFDDFTLDVVLRELDTISDLTAYLTAKEKLVSTGKSIWGAGEEELLAHYIVHMDDEGQHNFVVPKNADLLYFDEGSWRSVTANWSYIAKKEANNISYSWDNLIELFNKHIVDGTLEEGNSPHLSDHELGVRIMASEDRFSRRGLSQAFITQLRVAEPNKDHVRHTISSHDSSRV